MLLPSTGAGSAEGERSAERAASVSHRIAPRPAAKAAAPRPGPHRPVTATPGLAPTCRAPSPARRRAGRCRGGRGSRRKRRTKKTRAAHARTPMAARTLLVPSAPAGSLRACAHRPAAPCASGGGGDLGRAGSGAQAPLLGAERQGAGRAPPSGRTSRPSSGASCSGASGALPSVGAHLWARKLTRSFCKHCLGLPASGFVLLNHPSVYSGLESISCSACSPTTRGGPHAGLGVCG